MNTVVKLSHKEYAESVEHENTLFTQEKRKNIIGTLPLLTEACDLWSSYNRGAQK